MPGGPAGSEDEVCVEVPGGPAGIEDDVGHVRSECVGSGPSNGASDGACKRLLLHHRTANNNPYIMNCNLIYLVYRSYHDINYKFHVH